MKLSELLTEIRNLSYEDLVILATESNTLMQMKYLKKTHTQHILNRSAEQIKTDEVESKMDHSFPADQEGDYDGDEEG